MIVNANPYDTGFDENSHVMRFSAVAREVQTTASNKVTFPSFGLKRQISSQFSAFKHAVTGSGGTPARVRVSVPVLASSIAGLARGVGVPNATKSTERESEGFVMIEEELEVVEEPDSEVEEDEDEGTDPLVDYLFEQVREYKTRVGFCRSLGRAHS
jgi:kinesin family protein 20